MAREAICPTGRESPFGEEELIVSKTDLKGRLVYVNDVFLRVARMTEQETIGEPHNIIRHPETPRAIFKLLWDRIQSGREIFAYVLNLAKDGSHYWVFAHVTPSRNGNGDVVGFHSNRRKPSHDQVAKITPLYRVLSAEEHRHTDRKEGLKSSFEMLEDLVKKEGKSYDEFIFSV